MSVLARMFDRFWHGCGGCRHGEGCALLEQLATQEPVPNPTRLPLAIAAGVVFLMPLAMGIAGAAIVERAVRLPAPLVGLCSFGGLVAGVALGVALARGLFWVFSDRRPCAGRPDGE